MRGCAGVGSMAKGAGRADRDARRPPSRPAGSAAAADGSSQKRPAQIAAKGTRRPKRAATKEHDAAEALQNFFGANLRAARIRRRMTQAELGEKSGLGAEYISKVENGRQNLTLTTMATLAKIVGSSVVRMLRPRK